MSLDSKIISALTSACADIQPNRYTGTAKTYMVFNYYEMPTVHAEGKPNVIRYSVQVHYYCPHGTNPNTKKSDIAKKIWEMGCATYPSITNASDNTGQHYVFEFEYLEGLVLDGTV